MNTCTECGWPSWSWRHNPSVVDPQVHQFTVAPPLPTLRTPTEWEQLLGFQILDPDGWDRSNFEVSWAEPISESEFRTRLAVSTARLVP